MTSMTIKCHFISVNMAVWILLFTLKPRNSFGNRRHLHELSAIAGLSCLWACKQENFISRTLCWAMRPRASWCTRTSWRTLASTSLREPATHDSSSDMVINVNKPKRVSHLSIHIRRPTLFYLAAQFYARNSMQHWQDQNSVLAAVRSMLLNMLYVCQFGYTLWQDLQITKLNMFPPYIAYGSVVKPSSHRRLNAHPFVKFAAYECYICHTLVWAYWLMTQAVNI